MKKDLKELNSFKNALAVATSSKCELKYLPIRTHFPVMSPFWKVYSDWPTGNRIPIRMVVAGISKKHLKAKDVFDKKLGSGWRITAENI